MVKKTNISRKCSLILIAFSAMIALFPANITATIRLDRNQTKAFIRRLIPNISSQEQEAILSKIAYSRNQAIQNIYADQGENPKTNLPFARSRDILSAISQSDYKTFNSSNIISAIEPCIQQTEMAEKQTRLINTLVEKFCVQNIRTIEEVETIFTLFDVICTKNKVKKSYNTNKSIFSMAIRTIAQLNQAEDLINRTLLRDILWESTRASLPHQNIDIELQNIRQFCLENQNCKQKLFLI